MQLIVIQVIKKSAYQVINLIKIFNQLTIPILLYTPQTEYISLAAMTAVTKNAMHAFEYCFDCMFLTLILNKQGDLDQRCASGVISSILVVLEILLSLCCL